MKRIILSVSVIFITTCGLFAQDVKFGVRGGMNLPNIMAGGVNTPVSEGYKSRLAGGFGLFTELQLNPAFSVRFGVEYSGMGGKKEGVQAMPTQRLMTEMLGSMSGGMFSALPEELTAPLMGWAAANPYYYANVDNTTKFDYVMIPVLAQYGWDIGQSPWRVYVNAGPFVSFALKGRQATEGTSKLFSDASGTTTLWDVFPPDTKMMLEHGMPEMFAALQQALGGDVTFGETNITGELRSTNFGVIGNVGIRYQHGRHNFFLEAGGNYGFITVQTSETNGSNRIGAASVMLGYAVSLF